MNRYGAGGPSKATSSTLCQKCLKRGHFSYECKASEQDRPYISRPSRTQQLANPKLAPKLTNKAPAVEPPKVSSSDIIKSSASARGRKNSYDDVDSPLRRSPSVSSHSDSDSVSSISTNRSRSRSPPPRREANPRAHRNRTEDRRRSRSRSRDRHDRPRPSHRRRDDDRDDYDRKAGSHRARSPPRRSHRRSRSPDRASRRERETSRSRSPYRRPSDAYERNTTASRPEAAPPIQRERSLSPFSKRQALTRAQYGGP